MKVIFVAITMAAWLLSPFPFWVLLADGDKEIALCLTGLMLLISIGIASTL